MNKGQEFGGIFALGVATGLGYLVLLSRNADPVDQLVVSVTSFETSSKAFNVIPQGVTLRGTVRTMSPGTMP